MKKRYKIFTWFVGILAIGLGVLGVLISRDTPCGPAPDSSGDTRAWQYRCYGGAEVLQLVNVPKPVPADDEVIVKVRAAAVNPLDWHYLRGTPYVMRLEVGFGAPKDHSMGVDYAGVVDSVGKSVTKFKAGDEVFGARGGAFGDYVAVRESRNIVLKPASVSFEEAAAVPIAAITALQAVRDQGLVKSGQKVLINGASGGVGTYAVQLAKNLGAEVTGVCSGRNLEMVSGLGADHVIDYTKDDYTRADVKYDVIIDNVGNHSFSENRQVMTEKGILVVVGGPQDNQWIGPMTVIAKAPIYSKFVSQQFRFFLANVNPEDLGFLRDLMAAGKLKSVIDKTYKFSELPEAIRYLETGRARGKVVISVE